MSVLQITHCAVGYWSILEYEMDLDKITRFGCAPETSHSLRFSGVLYIYVEYQLQNRMDRWDSVLRIQVDREQ